MLWTGILPGGTWLCNATRTTGSTEEDSGRKILQIIYDLEMVGFEVPIEDEQIKYEVDSIVE